MRGGKSTGGLTRGRLRTEFQRAKWVLSMPTCAEMSNAMQEVTATQMTTSDQHIESSEGRSSKDASDSLAITSFLAERNLFSGDPSLRNIVTGVVADSDVDVTEAEEKGLAILKSMKGKSAAELSFKKSDQVKTLGHKNSKTGNNEKLPTVDPQLLFQRCLTGSASISISQSELFCFELCGYPSALFESHQFIPQPNKANLAEELWKTMNDGCNKTPEIPLPNNMQYVLDGGSLLHRLRGPWRKGSSFGEIVQAYVQFVDEHYPNSVVVFDGYNSGPSTKDLTHLSRSKGLIGKTVHLKPDMKLQTTKEQFLVNVKNKELFIKALGIELERTCTVIFFQGRCRLEYRLSSNSFSKIATHSRDWGGHRHFDFTYLLCGPSCA